MRALPVRGLIRYVRAANLTFWRGVNADARHLMAATLIFSLLIMGIESVTRVLFVLRLGLGTEFFGTFNAFKAIGYTSLSVPAGVLGQRIGLRNAMLLGTLVITAGYVSGSLVERLPPEFWAPYTLGTQLITTAGFALFWVNASPGIMSTTRVHNRSKIYGAVTAAGNFGALVGILAGGVLPTMLARTLNLSLAATDPYRLTLLWTALCLLPAFYAVMRFREEEAPTAEDGRARAGQDPFPLLPMAVLTVFVMLTMAAQATCMSFCNAYMDTDLSMRSDAIGVLGAAAQLCAVFAPLAAPRLSQRLRKANLLAVSALGTSVTLLPVILVRNWIGAGVGRLGVGVLGAIWSPILSVYQMEMVPRRRRPLAFALISAAQGVCFGTLSYFGARVITHRGYPAFFLIGALLTAAGSALLFALSRQPFMQPGYAD